MRRLIGQAAIDLGHVLHRVAATLLALALVGMTAVGALGWRLSQGPLDITWLARAVAERAAPKDTNVRVTIGAAALAWEGWKEGLDHPLDIRLSRVAAAGTDGTTLAAIPQARVSLSFAWLLLGRIVPRAVEIEGARLRAVRMADGGITTVLGSVSPDAPNDDAQPDPFGELLRELARPAETDASTARQVNMRWSQLRRVRIDDAELVLVDRQLGLTWRAPQAALDLRRGDGGGVEGEAQVTLALGDQKAILTATARLQPGGRSTRIQASFSKLAPASLANVSPSLAALAAFDVPVEGTVDLALGPTLDITRARAELRLGAGTVLVAQGTVPVAGATVTIASDGQGGVTGDTRLRLAGRGTQDGPVIRAHGTSQRAAAGYAARVSLDVDQIGFADLGQYWPRGTDHGARNWITANITAGVARAAHADLALTFGGGAGVKVTEASGQLTGDDLTVSWLRPVPPIEHGQALLTIVSPDELLITVSGGHQAGGAVLVRQGSVRITGVSQKDQIATIDAVLAGPLADAWTLLHQPRLQLLSRHPIDIDGLTGQLSGKLHLDVPLENNLTIEQIGIHAQGQLSDVHLALSGRALDQGMVDFDVTGDGLKLDGTARLVGIAAKLGLVMDFRNGPPRQVQTKLSVAGDATFAQLAQAGLDGGGMLTGGAALSATLEERRDGSGQASVHADLQRSDLRVAPLGWHRAAGGAGVADIRIQLDHDHIVGVDRLSVEGEGVSIAGHAEFVDAEPSILRLDRVVLGATTASGVVRFGRPSDRTLRIDLSGPMLDLSGRFGGKAEKTPPKPHQDEAGTPWAANLRFDQVLLAQKRQLTGVSVQAENDGRVLHRARIAGKTAEGPFMLSVTPQAGGRELVAEAADAGALLAAADVTAAMRGGQMTMSGRFDDQHPGHRLTATAELGPFRLRGAPVAGKLLQAMTLYGLVDALQGPGLGVARMIVPFSYSDDVIELSDARAYSPSLGATAKGRVDLGHNTADLRGTIVPAYFFNTLLGGLPVLGKLFSPEKGGGLFAATYSVQGSLDDPSVGVNPLAALTPGFLRGVFGIFERK